MERFFKFKIAFLSAFAGLLFSLFFSPVLGKTITVVPSKDFPVKNAFQKAKDGDTILLRAGIYEEGALHLNKSLTILGQGNAILDGEGKYEILNVDKDHVTIQGLTFANSGRSGVQDIAALKIQNSNHILIANCRFQNDYFGILTQNCSYITYLNNHFQSRDSQGIPAANGIHCWKSNHLLIKNNTIEGQRDGIYLEFVTQSVIENNLSEGNVRYGMHFMFSVDNLYRKNTFQNNGAGVAVMYSKRVVMTENRFSENWGDAAYGLLLKEIDDSKIDKNIFYKNTTAIFSDGSNRIEIKDNAFNNNGWAMKLNASCTELSIIHNNFVGNTFDMATDGNLVLKSLQYNYWDKYEGYDLNRNGIGDIPYRPVTFYSLIIEQNQGALMLFRSFFVKLMDKAESIFPNLTPGNIQDEKPLMKKIKF